MNPGLAAAARLAVVLVGASLHLLGCREHAPARFATASSLPDQERHADGVAVDMTSEPPPFQYAAASEEMVVTLKAPLGEQAARKVLSAFFEAVAQESISGLTVLTSSGARVHDLRGGKQDRTQSVTSLWRERFSKHNYEQIPASVVYHDNAIGSYDASHIEQLPLAVRYGIADAVGPRDLLLRVPIVTASVLNERLFGNEIYFLLSERNDRYVITAMAEQIPF